MALSSIWYFPVHFRMYKVHCDKEYNCPPCSLLHMKMQNMHLRQYILPCISMRTLLVMFVSSPVGLIHNGTVRQNMELQLKRPKMRCFIWMAILRSWLHIIAKEMIFPSTLYFEHTIRRTYHIDCKIACNCATYNSDVLYIHLLQPNWHSCCCRLRTL